MQQMHGRITTTSKTIDTTNVKDTTAETTDTSKIIKDAMTKITDTTNMIKDAIAEQLIQKIINKRCHDKTTIAISSK